MALPLPSPSTFDYSASKLLLKNTKSPVSQKKNTKSPVFDYSERKKKKEEEEEEMRQLKSNIQINLFNIENLESLLPHR